MPEPVGGNHTIKIVLDRDGTYTYFECHTGDNGPCRWTCSQGCEIWDEECLRDHPRERLDYCNPLEFINNDDSYWYENMSDHSVSKFATGQ